MLTIRKENFRDDEINVILDGLVPENHLVRKIENAIDFSFIYDKVKDLYSPLGAPSIDPVVLIKIIMIILWVNSKILLRLLKLMINIFFKKRAVYCSLFKNLYIK